MSNSGKYSLLFTGLKDQDPTTLRKVKTVFVTDLELPIPEIQYILDNPPRSILSADQKNDLKNLLKSLKSAGALVEVVENGASEEKESEAEEEDDGFSFEIDLSELAEKKKPKNTKVWELSFDSDDDEEPSLLDPLPPKAPSSSPVTAENPTEGNSADAEPLEFSTAEDTHTLQLEPAEAEPNQNKTSLPEGDSDAILRLTEPSDLLELEHNSEAEPITEQPSLALETDTPLEQKLSLEVADSGPVTLHQDTTRPEETADPLDLMLISLDEDDEDESSSSASAQSRPSHPLQIQEDLEEEADDDETPSEGELDLLLINMDDDEEEGHVATSPSVDSPLPEAEKSEPEQIPEQRDSHDFDLAFDESDSSQLSEDSPHPAVNHSEVAVLTNFSTNIDDLIPQLESQKETFVAMPLKSEESPEDISDLSLGELGADTSDIINTTDATSIESPLEEHRATPSDDQLENTEEQAPKRKSKPSFIKTNQSKESPHPDPSGLTLKEGVDVDDDGPTIAYLNTQARLSRQAEQRKETLRYSILYGIICLVIFIGGNWILFSFVLNNGEEQGPIIAPVTDADITKVKIEEPVDPKTPLNPDLALIKETVSKELILQSKSPTFSLRATCGASDQGLVNCKISGEGVESEMPSKRDRANGIKQPPWLTRLESDEITFNLVKKDESRIAEGTANAYIMYDKLSNRVTANVTLRTSPPPSEDALKRESRKLTVEIYFQKEVPASEGLEVSLTKNRQFALAAKALFDF